MAYKRRVRKTYQELTFTDDYMFCKVLSNDLELSRQLLELLLDRDIRKVELADPQHEISITSDIRSVRFDVYLNDEEGTVYDLEMQTANSRILPRRSRYYHSITDIAHLTRGESFSELPDSYVIFICTFDPFGKDLARYEFRNLCVEDPTIDLGDGAYKVFINAKGREEKVSGDMRAFLDYLCGKKPSSELTHYIASSIEAAKGNKTWERDFMTFEEKMREEREEGRKEGREEGRKEGREEGRKEGREEGREEGRKEGREAGERMFAELTKRLIEAQRNDDLEAALDNADLRKDLYREFGLEED